MKLKYKITLLTCISSLLLVLSFATLVIVQKARIDENVPPGDILNDLLWWTLIIGLIILVMTTVSAWVIAKKIFDPIVKITSIARYIATGDLSSAADFTASLVEADQVEGQQGSGNETRELQIAIKAMTKNLNFLVGQVQRSGHQITSSSKELSIAAEQHEMTLTSQTGSMNKVQKSVEEISNITADLVKTMHHVTSMSQETAGVANSGHADLLRMGDVMQQMDRASQSISAKLESINQKADNIVTVVTTVAKVAEQTNLLSLNAAIEAEKAGEYGRGFSVIAREIRRLADQTAVSTLNIDQVVKEMQSAVSAGVMEMDKFIVEVRNGVQNVENTSAQQTRIIQQVQALLPNFASVSAAMEHQSQNAQQINGAMVNLGSEMEQTMESLRESYLAIAQLNEAAKILQDGVSRFEVSFTILKEIDIFLPFSDEAISYLNHQMHSRHFAAGETIIKQGEAGDSLFIIAKGDVEIWVEFQDGKTAKIANVTAGDVVGEMALLTGEPRTASLICATDTHVFEITKEDIAPFIEQQPEIAKLLGEILTVRKLKIEGQKSLHRAEQIDEDALSSQILGKIHHFFGLNKE